MTSPFLADLLLLAVVTAGTWFVPETVSGTGRLRLSVTRPTIPERSRATFARAATAGFAVLGLFTSLAPAVLGRLLHLHSPALAGAVVCTLFAASTIGQITLVKLLGRGALVVGCVVLIVGMAFLAAALTAKSLALLLTAAVTAGSVRA